jgi:exonuclease SbcC
MQILSLGLDNTKSYQRASLTFAEGVNAIVGQNGAGKSTILEAIGFTLFDALEYKHEEFVREEAETAEIAVEFLSSGDGRRYRVVRRCGSSNLYRVLDVETGLKVCEGKADVLRFLRQQMGIDPGADLPALFRDAVGVPQGAFTAVFLDTASKRKPTFDRLLRVEEYSRAADRMREPARVLRERRQEFDIRISGLAARLERLGPLEAAVTARRQKVADHCIELERGEQQLQRVSASRAALEQIQQQIQSVRQRQIQLTALAENLVNQVMTARQGLAQAEQARATVAEHQHSHDQYLVAQGRQLELETRLRQRQQVERQQAEVERTLAQVQTELAAVERDLADVSAAEARLAALLAPLAEQERLEAELTTAQQQLNRLDENRRQVTTHAEQLARLRTRLAALTQQQSQAAGFEQRAQAIDEQMAALRQTIEDAKEEQIACKNSAEMIRKQNEALADISTAKCPVCEQPLSEAHRSAMLQRNEERLQSLRSEYKRISDQLRRDEETLKAHEGERKQVQQQLLRLPRAEEGQQVEAELNQAAAALSAAEALVAELAAAPQQVDAIRSQLSALDNPRQHYAVASAAAARRPALETKQKKGQTEQTTLQQQLADFQQQLATFAGLDEAVDQVRQALRQHEPAYQAVLTHRQVAGMVEERRAHLEKSLALQAQAAAEVQQVEAELQTLSAGFDQAAFQQALAEEQTLRTTLARLQTELRMMEQQQASDEKEIADLHNVQRELSALEEQKARVGKQEEVLDALRDLLKRAGPQVTKALIQQVSRSADQIFCEMMQDYTRRLHWNEEYGIQLEVAGRLRHFAQLSGGEQMCAALAVRLALLREMSNIDIAFFDEPTTNLDEVRRDSLVRQILDIRGFRQLFVISHDDTFEQTTQNLIRIERVNGLSVVVEQE